MNHEPSAGHCLTFASLLPIFCFFSIFGLDVRIWTSESGSGADCFAQIPNLRSEMQDFGNQRPTFRKNYPRNFENYFFQIFYLLLVYVFFAAPNVIQNVGIGLEIPIHGLINIFIFYIWSIN